VILGSAATPVAMATAAIAEQAKTPHISMAPIPTQPWRFSATAAILAAGVYFALQRGVELLLAGALPPAPALNDPIDLAITLGVITAFAAITWLQSQLGRANASPVGQALYVHLAQGLYLNTLANRLVLRWWPKPLNTSHPGPRA